MNSLANIMAVASGFVLMGYRGQPANLLATSIVVNLALAPMTAVIASRRNRSVLRWTIGGLALGAWALATVLLLPASNEESRPPAPKYPPTSDAA
ncbi:MAG TPA: hypothetical protein VMA09_10040 [Candidatus Binataceae bacterium]|nr:hypothetical protein [Candidatus Binataceae bacterium]